jgi:hypothetical protein
MQANGFGARTVQVLLELVALHDHVPVVTVARALLAATGFSGSPR